MAQGANEKLDKELPLQILFTVEEAGNLLGLGRSTIYILFKKCLLTPLKVGNATRVSGRSINRYVDFLESEAQERRASRVKGGS